MLIEGGVFQQVQIVVENSTALGHKDGVILSGNVQCKALRPNEGWKFGIGQFDYCFIGETKYSWV